MDATQPRAVITHYFDLMGGGGDFATCYAEDVMWKTFDGGTVISGPTEVRDYLTGLHRNMPDIRTRPIAYADEAAYVEGDCADPRSASTDRIPFCIAYDIANGVITAARCYGAIGFLAPDGRVRSVSDQT
jgi:SnoaL-like protein